MTSILKKISSFLCVPVKEFNRVKLHYVSDETEIVYTFKGSFFWNSNLFKLTDKKYEPLCSYIQAVKLYK